jgi:predicted PurR-regulated permease PerM
MKKERVSIDITYESILRFFLVSFALFFLFYIRDVIFIILIATLLALIMEPAVDRMQKESKIPRLFGTSILFLSVFFVFGLVLYTIVPILAKEVGQLATNLPDYTNKLNIQFQYFSNNQQNLGMFSDNFQGVVDSASSSLASATASIISSALGIFGGIFSVILILVISFYLVIENNGIEKFVRASIPDELQPQFLRIVKKIESKMGKWFVGQLTLGLIVGILSFAGLYAIGVPYALALAMVAGIFELIPYIGPTLSAIPAILIALTVSPGVAALTIILYFFIQEFENHLIVPKVMEKSVGLHPVITIFAALIGGQLAGIPGIILAVPVATIISIIYDDIRSERNHNS